jgi:hypothetical protein
VDDGRLLKAAQEAFFIILAAEKLERKLARALSSVNKRLYMQVPASCLPT